MKPPSTCAEVDRSEIGPFPSVWTVAAGFLLLALCLRSSSFFLSAENWDESAHLLGARSLLDGHLPYTEFWDHKPPGIYFLFALAQLVLGRTILSIRILAAVAVTGSSLLLFLVGRRLRSPLAGTVAGLLYVVFSLNDGGLASNLEIFFTPLVVFTFWLFFEHRVDGLLERPAAALALGLAAGCALQIKYVAVFDLAALGLLVLRELAGRGGEAIRGRRWRCIALLIAGPVVTFALVALLFFATGHFRDYWDANFAANIRYASAVGIDLHRLAVMIRRRIQEAFPLWLGLFLTPFYLLFFRSLDRGTRFGLAAGLLWAVFAFAGVCSTRRLFAHYFLEPLPPLCLLCSLVITGAVEPRAAESLRRTGLILALVLLGPVLRAVDRPISRTVAIAYHRYVEGIEYWGDEPAAVAAYLRPRLQSSDYLYVADYQPVLYYLLSARTPTKYAFPPFLVDEQWKGVAGIDPQEEVQAIFLKRPLYVVKSGDRTTPFYRTLDRELDRSYQLEHTIGRVELYRRRD